ncbi:MULTISPECIES: flagellar biosynthesis protein FlhF [Burkholderiaceae]|jgi:flagellar biosynthesis protein FlhF|uniref:Flagellar biosynthesis protein FlhF n=1 Tax=Caballeronia sordidicola TaxID=196367 RepID=A0A242M968_CABSO|nr:MULTISPECIES: flagellar biosynthesis protein FlhF [Burkholderiaceae]AME23359.1 flagellar biosynthesis protein FlhF [Burkholderia sp. PAMC 26561]OTP67811.1 Flagellar biosynthesis protein FlhF [Caballeronia sordidicola]
MNIRKFIGATSRDAFRLVREALGPDAVVLSNRVTEDGSVEIVAVADGDLAKISPKAAAQQRELKLREAPVSTSAPTAHHASNPYASGDVFSSVFGANPEPLDALDDNEPAPEAEPLPRRMRAAQEDSSRTMAESNPWLIEHARRVAQTVTEGLPQRSMSASAAIAKGLGSPVTVVPQEAHQPADAPEWTREAAQLAARRAENKLAQRQAAAMPMPMPAQTPEPAVSTIQEGAFAGLPASAAAAVTEAIRARMEQVVNDTVMHELSSMRGMMEEHFAGLLWGDRQRRSPNHAALTKRLFAAGFSAQLVRMLIDNMPEIEHAEASMQWVQQVLENNLPVMDSEESMMNRGGVFALMGPTGVGKTTTTAKLAARCVMRFGASKVALLTTDSYRIGAHEQLRIFGKILGVSVHAVKDAADLQLALSELRNKHIVLIDTIGMSQRDRTVSDHIAMLCGAGLPVQRLLLLNATSHGDTLNEVVQAYQSTPDQPPLAGCILTKLDEATNLGGVIDTVIRYKLPVHYVSTGQKVPENLYVATKRFLIKSAFCIPRDGSPFVPQDDDVPPLLSALSARASTELHEVHFG